MLEENFTESILDLNNKPMYATCENDAHCELSDTQAEQHTWARSTAPGWFLCIHCGAVAICPACLPAEADEPAGAMRWKCSQHQ